PLAQHLPGDLRVARLLRFQQRRAEPRAEQGRRDPEEGRGQEEGMDLRRPICHATSPSGEEGKIAQPRKGVKAGWASVVVAFPSGSPFAPRKAALTRSERRPTGPRPGRPEVLLHSRPGGLRGGLFHCISGWGVLKRIP